MSIKLGLISDVHASPEPLRQALQLLTEQGCERLLCAGDIAGYGSDLEQTVALLRDYKVETILGNHDLWYLERCESFCPAEDFLGKLPAVFEQTIAGKRLYMVHASPPGSLLDGIKLLDQDGQLVPELKQEWTAKLATAPFDLLVVGHTHQVFAERCGDLLVVTPGSTLFNHTCAVVSLPELTVEHLPLPGQEPRLSWNWGQDVAEEMPESRLGGCIIYDK